MAIIAGALIACVYLAGREWRMVAMVESFNKMVMDTAESGYRYRYTTAGKKPDRYRNGKPEWIIRGN